MAELVQRIFVSNEFMPHGHCFFWKPGLLWLHVSSDGLIGTAYLVISLLLWGLARRIRIPFSPMILAFGLFIGACGLTHYMEILTLWVPDYWLSGAVKAVTAAASVATGAYLFQEHSSMVGVAREAQLSGERRQEIEAAHRELQVSAERHERAFRALSECSEVLVRASHEQELLDRVCRIFVDVCGYRLAFVGLALNDERKTVRPVAHAGHEDGYLALVDAVWADAPSGRGPSGTAIRTRKPVVVADVLSDADFAPWREEAVKRGYASLVALPLLSGEACLGVLQVHADRVDAFDDAEMKLLLEVADDLAFGLTALRARLERDRMTSQLMLADRMVSIGTLAAGVAHEINNPLTYVIGALEFADHALKGLAGVPGVEVREVTDALAAAREGAERVRHVVRDLKTFSRADEERQVRLDLRPVVESSINMAFNEMRYRARLVKDFGATPPVLANEARLGQVFLNLLINAAQAIPEGRVDENEVRVVTRTDPEGRAVVEVHDTGSGIPEEILARIFDPFFTTKPGGVGTGLGLSISRNIVASLGGEIAVESRVGEGSLFRVTLPPARATAEAAAAPAAHQSQGRRGRVLVVDDEPAIGESLRRLLRSEHEVVVLGGAAQALELVAGGERFDAILCDLMMPQMTGMDLHAELARLAPDQAERMVLLTGGAFTATARQFLDAVPNQRVEKPFDSANLRAIVRGLVR